MDTIRKAIIDNLVEGHTTNTFQDAYYHAELLKIYKKFGDKEAYDYLVFLIMEARKNWLLWYTENQRKWQTKSKNKHHDSFMIRENYLAPHANNEWEFREKADRYNRMRKPELYIWKYGIR